MDPFTSSTLVSPQLYNTDNHHFHQHCYCVTWTTQHWTTEQHHQNTVWNRSPAVLLCHLNNTTLNNWTWSSAHFMNPFTSSTIVSAEQYHIEQYHHQQTVWTYIHQHGSCINWSIKHWTTEHDYQHTLWTHSPAVLSCKLNSTTLNNITISRMYEPIFTSMVPVPPDQYNTEQLNMIISTLHEPIHQQYSCVSWTIPHWTSPSLHYLDWSSPTGLSCHVNNKVLNNITTSMPSGPVLTNSTRSRAVFTQKGSSEQYDIEQHHYKYIIWICLHRTNSCVTWQKHINKSVEHMSISLQIKIASNLHKQ